VIELRDQPSLTLRERFEHLVARSLARLPPSLQVCLSGKPPLRIDDDTQEQHLVRPLYDASFPPT
jgi:hypothetical protein